MTAHEWVWRVIACAALGLALAAIALNLAR
jgi:hypothetical protein